MPSIFSKIVSGEIPAFKIAENDQFLAFLDVFPIAKGHTLVIPKKETDYILNVEDEEYKELWLFAKNVGLKVEKVIPCERIGIAVIGLEVPHTHIHLVPINEIADLSFSKPKLKFSDNEMRDIASSIREA